MHYFNFYIFFFLVSCNGGQGQLGETENLYLESDDPAIVKFYDAGSVYFGEPTVTALRSVPSAALSNLVYINFPFLCQDSSQK